MSFAKVGKSGANSLELPRKVDKGRGTNFSYTDCSNDSWAFISLVPAAAVILVPKSVFCKSSQVSNIGDFWGFVKGLLNLPM